ncbi:MAG: hypothetical protein B7C24_14260, partial [Bacteroidetes bacterium 4572_77]
MKTLKQKHAELSEIIGEAETLRLLHNWYSQNIRKHRKRKGLPKQDPELFRLIHDDLNARLGIKTKLG